MLVLALDTTTRQGSIALARDGALAAVYAGDAGTTHGERLPGDALKLLAAHALRVADVDLFAVASGPGSFTGLRIGIAAMQGFALANRKPLAGVSALDALNAVVCSLSPQPFTLNPDREVSIWMDAQRGQVFSAVYTNGVAAESAIVDKPADILARWQERGRLPRVFAGDGALAYRDLIRRAAPDAEIIDPLPPLAPAIATLAEADLQQKGPASPDEIRPLYIRRSDAELARDRAAEAPGAAPAAKVGRRA
jgi:tRNA threonylcarbamoyladenosine biosynthesis protein TsaB